MIRTRLAPSPTGFLHIGTARTALFNFLFAKKNAGSFILRIEDTDIDRSSEKFEKDIVDGLLWLGITWDEGPTVGGPHAPYRQHARSDMYTPYLKKLYDTGNLYHCYCTKEELERERELQLLARQPPRYSGKCRALTEQERRAREDSGTPSTLRFAIRKKTILRVTDMIRGELTFDTQTLDDFIIAKDFVTPLYNIAVVIDDALMNITHVIRGEEHISNIPKQLLLAGALDLAVPAFAHLPLILNADRTKLSKRHNNVSLLDYRRDGYMPAALINFMALLGWNPGTERELYTLEDLTEAFDLDHVSKSGAVFNVAKLDWFNASYIKQATLDHLVESTVPYLEDKNILVRHAEGWHTVDGGLPISRAMLTRIIALEQSRLKKLSDIISTTQFFFEKELEFPIELLAYKGAPLAHIQEALEFAHTLISSFDTTTFDTHVLESAIKRALESAQRNTGEVLWPLRVALTGLAASPPPFDVMSILGKERTLERITRAIIRIREVG